MPKPGGSALADRSVTAKLAGFLPPGTIRTRGTTTYPDMTTDEVLLFRNAHYRKGDEDNGAVPVFHSAFAHPETPKDAEPRLSFEYRVAFLV